ncbi:MAG: UPF0182 family protein [Actinomycetota bacterium]
MRVPPAEAPRRSFGLRGWLIAAAAIIVFLLLSLRVLAGFYTDALWFSDVGFGSTWRALLEAKVIPALVFTAAFFVVMLVNLIVADRVAPKIRSGGSEDEVVERYRRATARFEGWIRVAVSLFFAIAMGSGVVAEWQRWVLFTNATSFGTRDPQFDRDIGFYIFRLPFLRFAAGWIFGALLVVLVVTTVFHYLNGGIRFQQPFQRVTPQVKVHLSVLLALMALTKTAQYWLAQYSLVLSRRGAVDGATYTDINAQLPALRLLMVISIAAAGLFIVNIWRRGWVFPVLAVGLWAFIAIVVGTIVPAVVQRFTVQPNELSREKPYIARNIEATREAFGLSDEDVRIEDFSYQPKLEAGATREESATLGNVRLYDPRPAQDDFKVDEARSTAYEFADVDVDRYPIGREKSKPMLVSVRELDEANLPDTSWTSRHLVYTHGYGVVAAAADQVDGDRPSYVLQGIPPEGEIRLDENYAPVYFGETMSGYVVVDTKVPEQEASATGKGRTTRYEGDAGIPVSSFLRRSALALRFSDWNLLVSGQITDESRLIFGRSVAERVRAAAPFLRFDADPYPVVDGGRITWVVDGYTISSDYPYSQSLRPNEPRGSGLDTDFNYVRNSVKATIDAYDGTMRFYVVDDSDPMIRAYAKAFPDLFTDGSEVPAGLRSHFRYPEDLFTAQTQQYALYHITDPVQYFNKQDIWDVVPTPETTLAVPGTTLPVTGGNDGGRNTTLAPSGSPAPPLYLTLQVPGRDDQEFVLQRSFTPRRKNGILSSFMFALNDGPDYGKLVLFSVADSSAPSSFKAASAIESDQFISSQFTLLGQGGSSVEKGNVQLVPIGDSILYLRPIWITGEGQQPYPRYRFIAAVVGDRAVLGYDVADVTEALLTGGETRLQADVRGGRSINDVGPDGGGGGSGPGTTTTTVPTTPTTGPAADATVSQLLQTAQREFAAADAALKAGRLGEYEQRIAAARAAVSAAASRVDAGS